MADASLHRRAPVRAALAALLLVVTACGDRAEEETAPQGQAPAGPATAVAVVSLDIRGVNELLVGGTAMHTALFYYMLFLPLAEEQADYHDGPPSFEPRLAESWELSDDRLELVFHLRENARWSDGVPITAEDVRWTWLAQTDPEVAWAWASAKERIRDVEVRDERTVVFHFTEAYATQLLDAVTGVILPRHVWSELPFAEWRQRGDWFLEHLVTSGPFRLEAWEPDQRIVLTRNPDYFAPGLPGLDRLVLRIVPDRSSQLALLRSGEAHLVEWIRPGDVAAVRSDPELEVVAFLPRWYTYLLWNVRRAPFDDVRVRRALTLGLDRRTILDTLYDGEGRIDSSVYPSDLWVDHEGLEPWPFDPAAAEQLLTEAGWTDDDGDGVRERDGKPLRIEILTNADNELRRDVLVMVQDQLRRIGVEVVPTTFEFSTLFERLDRQEFDAVFGTLSVDTTLDLSFVFHSSAIGSGYNWGGWSDPETDRLIEATRSAVDPVAAEPDFRALQERLHQQLPLTVLWEQELLVGKRRELVDVTPNALSIFHDVERWRLDPGAP